MCLQRIAGMRGISASVVRQDAAGKCRGRAGYLDEMTFPEMLFARAVRSTRPRARIMDVQVPNLPDGYFLVDSKDLAGDPYLQFPAHDSPVFADGKVNFVGEAILLIVGPDRECILDICDNVHITYEDIPPILTLEDSISGAAPPLTGTDNIYTRREYRRGDVDKIFAESQRTFSGTYTTGYQEHFYLETLRIVASPENGGITLYGPVQGPDTMALFLSGIFGWPPERFSSVVTTVGGAFGGKIEMPIILAAHAALAAYKTGHPVAVIYDRHEDMLVSTKRHPSRVSIRSAFDGAHNLTALDVKLELMAGGYSWFCPIILDMAAKMGANAYRVANLHVSATAHATNHLMPGAMRGFGAMQMIFAIESHLSQVADRLGVDPLLLKERNALKTGDTTATGGTLRDDVKLPEIIAAVAKASDYHEKRRQWQDQNGRIRKGIGAAVYAFGAPHTMGMGPRRRPRPLSVIRRENGRVEISTNIVELGQGIQTTFRKIVAAALGIPLESIDMPEPRSPGNSPTGGTGASLSIVLFGKSLERAALRLKARWSEIGEITETEDFTEPEYLVWDEEQLCGDAYHTYSWGAIAVEVEVDTCTGEVRNTGIWCANDFGTPIDETIARGQVDGGVVQGLGYGLWEYLESQGGFLQQIGPADYVVATAMDVPFIHQEIIASYYPEGPFGAKSVGEMPIVGSAPALTEAVSFACKAPIYDIPLTAERVLALLGEAKR